MESIPDQEIDQLLKLVAWQVKAYYEPTAEYHGWDSHIAYSLAKANDYCDEAEIHGLAPNRLVVGLIVIFHDAGISHSLLGMHPDEFATKEEYSAHIAEQILPDYGFGVPGFLPGEVINQVKEGILSTAPDKKPASLEAQIACRADIANAEAGHTFFMLNAIRYKAEVEAGLGANISEYDYAEQTRLKLGALILRDEAFGEWDEDPDYPGYSRFVIRGIINLRRFYHRATKKSPVSITDFISQLQADLATANDA